MVTGLICAIMLMNGNLPGCVPLLQSRLAAA